MSAPSGRLVPGPAKDPGRPPKGLRIAAWVVTGCTALMLVALAWTSSIPGGYFFWALLLLAAWVLLGVVWLLICVITLVVDGRSGHLAERARAYWLLAVAPLLTISGVILVSSEVPQRTRFALDRPEFEAYVADVRAGRVTADKTGEVGFRPPGPAHRIGTVPVDAVTDWKGCVWLRLDDAGTWQSSMGYAHCLGTPPEEELKGSGYDLDPVRAGWYVWEYWG